MRLVHMAYKARKLCVQSAVSPGRQYNYGCIQLCNKTGQLLRELLSHADNCYQTNTLTKVCLSLFSLVMSSSHWFMSGLLLKTVSKSAGYVSLSGNKYKRYYGSRRECAQQL